MSAVLLIDGQVSDLDAFIVSIVEKTVSVLSKNTQSSSPSGFVLDSNKTYFLSNPELIKYMGFENLKQPVQAIAKDLRAHGIDPENGIGRRGLSVKGYQLVLYFDAVRKEKESYLKKS